MIRYIGKRLLWMIPVILGVLIIVFTISYFTPGDPAAALLGTGYTQDEYDALVHEMGLDQPFFVQLWNYINDLLHGDMGRSYTSRLNVADEMGRRYPTTIKLGLLSVVVTVALGVPLGIVSATKQYSIADYTLTTLALIIAAIPGYVLALFAQLGFSVKLGWLPLSGTDTWQAWILPVASSSLSFVAGIMRMTRTSMLEVIRADYIRTARSKGLEEKVITRKHALPNALIPIVTIVGMQLSGIVAGSIIVETIFNINGMGTYVMAGINGRDYPVINSCVFVLSLVICCMNLIVDIVYAFIDPRIKAQYVSAKRSKPSRDAKKPAEVA